MENRKGGKLNGWLRKDGKKGVRKDGLVAKKGHCEGQKGTVGIEGCEWEWRNEDMSVRKRRE